MTEKSAPKKSNKTTASKKDTASASEKKAAQTKVLKPKAPPVIKIFETRKLAVALDAAAREKSLNDETLAVEINSLPSILKAMRLGVEPDVQSKAGALKWLGKKESDFLTVKSKG